MDWFLVLAPLLLLPLLLLLRLVGCGLFVDFDEENQVQCPEVGLQDPPASCPSDERSLVVQFAARFFPEEGATGGFSAYGVEFELQSIDGSERPNRTIEAPVGGARIDEASGRWEYPFFACVGEGRFRVICRVTRAGDSSPWRETQCDGDLEETWSLVVAQQHRATDNLELDTCFAQKEVGEAGEPACDALASHLVRFVARVFPEPGRSEEDYEVEFELEPIDGSTRSTRWIRMPDGVAHSQGLPDGGERLEYPCFACVQAGGYRVTGRVFVGGELEPSRQASDEGEVGTDGTLVIAQQRRNEGDDLVMDACFAPIERGEAAEPSWDGGLNYVVGLLTRFYPDEGVTDFSAYEVEFEIEPIDGADRATRWLRSPAGVGGPDSTDPERWQYPYWVRVFEGRYRVACRALRAGEWTARGDDEAFCENDLDENRSFVRVEEQETGEFLVNGCFTPL